MICNECETVAHCTKHGCVPKQPSPVQEPVAIPEYIRDAAKHLHENRFEPSFMVRAIVGWINGSPPAQPAPVQEPVAWMQPDEVHISLWKDDYHTIPLYTTPPAAQQDIQRLSALVRAQQITIDKLEQALAAPVQEPVGCEGAILNGRVYADRLEHDYKFECEAGPLHLCNDWVEFRRCFEWLAVHATPPAQPALNCTRSHPHENMDAMCELRTEIARLTNENARLKAQPAAVQEPVATLFGSLPVYDTPPVQEPVRIYDYVWPQRDEHKEECVYACNYTPGHHLARGELLAVVHPSQLISTYLQRDNEAAHGIASPAAQRQWVGLTDEEKQEWVELMPDEPKPRHIMNLINVIEVELKEKNT